MKYDVRILAYIDILGFSDEVSNTIKNGSENQEEIQKLYNLLENVKVLHKSGLSINSKSVSNFSDSIAISYLKTDDSAIFNIFTDKNCCGAFTLKSIYNLALNFP